MEITFSETKQILDSLPIGLYIRRRISTKLDGQGQDSYYNPAEDAIVISFPFIREGALHTKTTDKEVIVRTLLYHEISHAMLTPRCYASIFSKNYMNIFEDERIETLLKDFYLDVDFKGQVLAFNGGQIKQPTNALSDFYNIVRFGVGKQEYVNEVDRIINKYSDINSTSENGVWDYYEEVDRLYQKVQSDWQHNKNEKPSQQDIDKAMQNIKQKLGKGTGANSNRDGQGKISSLDSKDNEKSEGGEGGNGKGEGSNQNNDSQGKASTDNQEGGDITGVGGREGGNVKNQAMLETFAQVTNQCINSALTEQFAMIINSFNKKNNSGNGTVAYSGIINPRNFVREDYRYFDKATSVNGNNKFGTCHLNLYIDVSGSFTYNEGKVNTIIHSLKIVEKRYKNFTFDVFYCGYGIKEAQPHKFIKCGGGNSLDYDNVLAMFKKGQKVNTLNYNIVLFDGDCGPKDNKALNPFDKSNVTMIMEHDNKEYVKNFTSAKVKFCDDSYAEQLTEEVLNAFRKAFS